MVVSVDVGLLQGWITIGCVAFGLRLYVLWRE
jgi:hypothetical protein